MYKHYAFSYNLDKIGNDEWEVCSMQAKDFPT